MIGGMGFRWPLPQLLAGILLLNQLGVKAICIPCNSAHCWYNAMQAASALRRTNRLIATLE